MVASPLHRESTVSLAALDGNKKALCTHPVERASEWVQLLLHPNLLEQAARISRSESEDFVNQDDSCATGDGLARDDESLVDCAIHTVRYQGTGVLHGE
jgi:hypothetical protein